MHAPAQVIRSRGDCEDARMFLRGFKEALPQAWLAAEQRVEMERKGEVDLLEEEEREKLQNEDLDELLEVALDTELRGSFVPFQEGDGDDPEAAEEGSSARRPYSLNPVPERLERDLQRYAEHRTAVLNRFRAGCAVGETTYENDRLNCLRFLGWLSKVYEPEEEEEAEVPAMRVKAVYGNCELGSYIDSYCGWLRDERGCKMSTIANYIQARAASYAQKASFSATLVCALEPILCCPDRRAPSTSPNTCTPTCSQPARSSRCRPAHRRRSTSSSTCGFRPRAPPGTTASTRADRRTGRAFSFIFCSGGS